MLLYLLFANTAHFTLAVLSAFVFFSAALLYFDSWVVNIKSKTVFTRSMGFLVLAAVQAARAASPASSALMVVLEITEVFGLILILASLIGEPVLSPPKTRKAAAFIPALGFALTPLSAVLYFLIALVYYRKSTEGYEKQLKPAALAFLFMGIAKIISVSFAWSDTSIVHWSRLLAKFGLIANIESAFMGIGIVILGVWIWGFIRFRLQIQLFVITIALSVFIFLSTTLFFTYLLLNNLQNDALAHLKTDTNVMQYSLESLKSEALAHAQAVAADNSVLQAFTAGDSDALYALTSAHLTTQGLTTLALIDSSGRVVVRAENRDATNESLKGDALFEAALKGESVSTLSSLEGVIAPETFIKAAAPVKGSDSAIVGMVLAGVRIDNSFVDGVKNATGLDTTIFGRDKRAATTLVSEDGKSRFVGTKEANQAIIKKVLENGETFIGTSQIYNRPYYVAYAPLTSFGGETIGMISVAKPENTLTDAAQASINLTFLGSIILITLSVIPVFFLSRFLKKHLEV